MHQTTRITLLNIVVACILLALVGAYFGIFVHYATDTPLVDDYYDCLYYLHVFNGTHTWLEKLHTIFWQYNKHKQLFNKLAYLTQYALLGRVDFYWMSLIGSLQLLLIPYFIWLLMRPRTNYATLLLPLPFFFFLNLGLWRPSYWAGAALATIVAVTLALAVCLLVQKKTRWSLVLALACLYILAFAHGNGILMAVLASFQILFSERTRAEKKIWFLMVLVLLIVFASVFEYGDTIIDDMSVTEQIRLTVNVLHLIPIGFFMLVGSAPFAEDDPAWLGAVVGFIVFLMILYMMQYLWKHDRQRFYPVLTCVLYCFISFVLIAFARIPFTGLHQAYDSHYKMYTLLLFSVVALFFIDKIPGKMLTALFCLLMISIPVLSSIHYFPVMVKSNEERRDQITAWTLTGTRDALGDSGWGYLSEQLLFVAAREKIYNPFITKRAARYQAKVVEQMPDCPTVSEERVVETKIVNNHGVLGAGFSVEGNANAFDEVWLCSSTSHYHLVPDAVSATRLVVEKNKFLTGDYSLYFFSNHVFIGRADDTLKIAGEKTGMPCEPSWDKKLVVSRQMAKEFCKKVFK